MVAFLSIIAIFNNEAMNMQEWLDHYIWQGVEQFYMIDNNSTDAYINILQPYIDRGIVHLYSRPKRHSQVDHYNDVLPDIRTTWLFVCDLDEFAFATKALTLRDFLVQRDSECDAVYTGMRMFASRDEYSHPPSLRHAFLKRERRIHEMGKGIIRLSSTLMLGIHRHTLKENSKVCFDDDNIHLNHYIIQSREFFDKVKSTRGDVLYTQNARDNAYFVAHDLREVDDDDILTALALSSKETFVNYSRADVKCLWDSQGNMNCRQIHNA
jgi:hypothetical protein